MAALPPAVRPETEAPRRIYRRSSVARRSITIPRSRPARSSSIRRKPISISCCFTWSVASQARGSPSGISFSNACLNFLNLLQINFSGSAINAICLACDIGHDYPPAAVTNSPGVTRTGIALNSRTVAHTPSNSNTRCAGKGVPSVSISPSRPRVRLNPIVFSSGLRVAGISTRLICSPKQVCKP